jgi:hypothetical protein
MRPLRLHSVLFERLAAGTAKPLTVFLEALLDGTIALRHLLATKPRRIA